MPNFKNELIHESSPYLLQHAYNPVYWHPWNEKALQKAKDENKLLIISIGYAACHWCHVMEHQSFEDLEVAELMNLNYVSIKVDREERPDIDQIYMTAVQAQTGRGGWPLNVIALPDGRPIYGGTYFPKEQWMAVLQQVHQFVQQNPVETEEQARVLTEAVNISERIQQFAKEAEFTTEDLNAAFIPFTQYFDVVNGGHKGAPKFPLPVGNQFLLQFAHLNQSKEALEMVKKTLAKLASGGIYDHIGGGYARYATDEQWRIPHFEKMLYDNAQLVSLYASAYKLTGEKKYKVVVDQTLTFVKRELTTAEGGFYSSLDADSEGEEGKYYIWSKEEINALLGRHAEVFNRLYNVTSGGNWEHQKNILYRTKTIEQLAGELGADEKKLMEDISDSIDILLAEREKRVRPALDDKILTSWNALMIKAYADAYQAFGTNSYLQIAERGAAFLKEKLISTEYRLNRNYKNGKASINAFLDDYAFTIETLITLYQSTFNELYLQDALYLSEYAIGHFSDNETGMFFYTSDIDPAQIARKMELSDNVIPASNSQMAKNLFLLGHYFANDDYLSRVKRMLSNVKDNVLTSETYYANWGILLGWIVSKPFEVVIMGDNFREILTSLNQRFLPNVLLSGGKKEGSLPLHKDKLIQGQTTLYVCRDKICKLPVLSAEEALPQLKTG